MPVPSDLEAVRQTKVKRWKWFIIMNMIFAVIAPTVILAVWHYILWKTGRSYESSSLSRVISSYRSEFALQISLVIPCLIMMSVVALVRNIQIHVYFVNDADHFALRWRYLNVFSSISFIVGIVVGFPGLIIFNTTDYPAIHVVFATIIVVCLFFGEFILGILTFKHRRFVHRRDENCKAVVYFIDAVWYIVVSVIGVVAATVYVGLYQSTEKDIWGGGNGGISEDYYKYQWIGVIAQIGWVYMCVVTIYIDQSDDEI